MIIIVRCGLNWSFTRVNVPEDASGGYQCNHAFHAVVHTGDDED